MYAGHRIAEILNGTNEWFQQLRKSDFGGAGAVAQAEERLRASVKVLVDQWIDSGQSRDLSPCHCATDRNIDSIPPGYERSLFDVITPSWNCIRPHLGLGRDGTVSVLDNSPSLDANCSQSSIDRIAVWFLTKLLQSQQARSLAQCANSGCRTYFVYDRAPKRVIKQGTFCPECKGKASSSRTRASRDRRQASRVEVAADLWSSWRSSFGVKRSTWIAHEMNLKLGPGEQIGRNGKWVTQNEEAIIAEVERRTHGRT
jgi:hypothetical protein